MDRQREGTEEDRENQDSKTRESHGGFLQEVGLWVDASHAPEAVESNSLERRWAGAAQHELDNSESRSAALQVEWTPSEIEGSGDWRPQPLRARARGLAIGVGLTVVASVGCGRDLRGHRGSREVVHVLHLVRGALRLRLTDPHAADAEAREDALARREGAPEGRRGRGGEAHHLDTVQDDAPR